MRAADLARTELVEPAAIRLVSTAYIDEPALAPLADDWQALEFLAELEGRTSARRAVAARPIGVEDAELLTEADCPLWTYVNAAFCHTREGGGRFNDEDRGAWYAAHGPDAAETAEAEVASRLTEELRAAGCFENVTAYRQILCAVAARLADLRGMDGAACLSPDRAVGYPAGQALAAELRAERAPGVLYPSARRDGGHCLALFRPNLVQNPRFGAQRILTWAGAPDPMIS